MAASASPGLIDSPGAAMWMPIRQPPAHFVTEKLDEGPLIVQQVIPVDHTHTAHDLSQAGRDVEQMVLARALRLVFEDRVFLCGNRTVIFD